MIPGAWDDGALRLLQRGAVRTYAFAEVSRLVAVAVAACFVGGSLLS
jgi:hypothetical protein